MGTNTQISQCSPPTGGEYEAAKQIKGRILLVRAGLLFERASAQLSYDFFRSA
jgi:hypothetical protein